MTSIKYENIIIYYTSVISGRDRGGHKNGKALALTLKRGDPSLSTEAHAGAK